MLEALADAGHLQPNQIDYINLHGTGTRDNDASEAVAVQQVFGASPPPLSSSKGALGHTLGAAGALEAALCVMAMQEGVMPPNWGLKELDTDLGLAPSNKGYIRSSQLGPFQLHRLWRQQRINRDRQRQD